MQQYDYYYYVGQERLAALRQEAEQERRVQVAQREAPEWYQHWTTRFDRVAQALKGHTLSERKI